MANWKQELQLEIAGIDDLNRNDAVLKTRIDTLDDFFGDKKGRIIEIERSLIVKAPEPVNVRLVDGLNYLSGDFICQIAFLRLQTAMQSQPDDPEIKLNNVVKTLEEVRPFNASNNWGIDVGYDTITIGNVSWKIAAVMADKWLDNEPALLELTLRKLRGENEYN